MPALGETACEDRSGWRVNLVGSLEGAQAITLRRQRKRNPLSFEKESGFCSGPTVLLALSTDQRLDRLALGDGQRTTQVVAHLRRRVDAEALVDRRVQVAERHRVLLDVGTVGARLAVRLAALDGAAAQHDRPAAAPVVAAGVLVDARRPTELT